MVTKPMCKVCQTRHWGNEDHVWSGVTKDDGGERALEVARSVTKPGSALKGRLAPKVKLPVKATERVLPLVRHGEVGTFGSPPGHWNEPAETTALIAHLRAMIADLEPDALAMRAHRSKQAERVKRWRDR